MFLSVMCNFYCVLFQGDYDPTKTKVLHFAMNPTALAQKRRGEELERLQEENAKLKKRLEVLEESGAQAVDVTMQVQSKLQEPSTSKELVGTCSSVGPIIDYDNDNNDDNNDNNNNDDDNNNNNDDNNNYSNNDNNNNNSNNNNDNNDNDNNNNNNSSSNNNNNNNDDDNSNNSNNDNNDNNNNSNNNNDDNNNNNDNNNDLYFTRVTQSNIGFDFRCL